MVHPRLVVKKLMLFYFET